MEPRQGVPPCTARLTSASGGPAGASRRGQGCRGRAPPTPCRQAWVAPVASRGRVLAPAGAAGRTNPLTRPPLEKRATGPHRGLEGHCRSGWGSRLAQRPRSGLALTPRNDPNAQGWWLGCSSPSRLPVANAPGGPPEALLPLIFASEVWGFGGGTPLTQVTKEPTKRSAGEEPFVYPGFRSEHDKRSLRKCALVPLREEASGAPERHPEVGLLVEHIQRVGSRSGASCGACWPPSITPLIPAFAIRFLRSWSSAITWFRALPFQPNSGLSL